MPYLLVIVMMSLHGMHMHRTTEYVVTQDACHTEANRIIKEFESSNEGYRTLKIECFLAPRPARVSRELNLHTS